MQRLIARQPILDRLERVYGYEIVFPPGGEGIWPPTNGCEPTESDCLGHPAFEEISEVAAGARTFIRCPPLALTRGLAAELPRDQVVLEVTASPEPDEQVVAACRRLKGAGFLLALEGYQGAWQEPLADVVDIIKVDVTASTDRAQWLLLRKYRPRGALFVADRVEKRTQFQAAVQQGFTYFQGQFFCRPQLNPAPDLRPTKIVYLLVLRAVSRPEIDVQEVADILKHDLALSYKLLRFLNSARFAFRTQIKSLRHALLLLGHNEVRKWIALISVTALGEGAPPILVTTALIRAAMCEAVAPLVGAPKRQSDYFFLGLLSCIDVIMGRPMRAVLAELPLPADVNAALEGEQNPLHDALQAVISYEQGNWGEFSQRATKLALKEEVFGELFLHALRWSGELTAVTEDKPADAPSS